MLKTGQFSTKVFFILHGKVFITDKTNKIVYATLGRGSCFGDISVLLDQPNKYNYLFNEWVQNDLFYLSVDSVEFQILCEKYPMTKKILVQRAIEKDIHLQAYKRMHILTLLNALNNKFFYTYNKKNENEFKLIDHIVDQYNFSTELRQHYFSVSRLIPSRQTSDEEEFKDVFI